MSRFCWPRPGCNQEFREIQAEKFDRNVSPEKINMRYFDTTKSVLALLTLGVCLPVSGLADEPSAAEEHPLKPAIRYAKACLEKVEALPGYEATFYKKEVVGKSVISQQMKIKVRHEPFSVYLYFQTPHEGREVIYVDGANNGKLLAHEAGLFSIAGTMELMPSDPMVMGENRYPITMAGIANAVKVIINRWEEETKYGEIDVKYFPEAKLGSLTCRVVEATHPVPRRQFDSHKIRMWVDTKSGLPVRMQKFGFPRKAGGEPPIIEDYTFTDIKTDTRLTDADFDRNNSKYSF